MSKSQCTNVGFGVDTSCCDRNSTENIIILNTRDCVSFDFNI